MREVAASQIVLCMKMEKFEVLIGDHETIGACKLPAQRPEAAADVTANAIKNAADTSENAL